MLPKDVLAFYRRRRVLVTGDTGFKGSWLALWLRDLGADVRGFALPPARDQDLFNTAKVGDAIQHGEGDLRDRSAVERCFDEFQPEVVFHLAAQALVRRSYDDPKETFDTNVGGSVNLLEAIRKSSSVRSLIYVTSDKCYHNREWVWGYRETDELGGHDPYSASKAAAEIVFESYRASFFTSVPGLGVASARAGNVIGGGDWAKDRIIPDCILALQESRPILLRNPHATRPWQHVLEPLYAYLLLGANLAVEAKKYSGAWNFGPESQSIKTVQDLAQAVIVSWGQGQIEILPNKGPHEAGILHLNCDKAHQSLAWRPVWSFARTVAATVEWYREFHHGADAKRLTLKQIQAFTADLEARESNR